MEEEHSHIKKDIMLRVRLLYFVFLVMVLVVFGRLIWVQWGSHAVEEQSRMVAERIFSEVELSAHRGSILSRHGVPFAKSIFRYQVEFDFAAQGLDSLKAYHEQADSLSGLLAKFFGRPSERAFRKMFHEEHDRRYRLINPRDTSVIRSEGWFAQLIDRMMGREMRTYTIYDTLRNNRLMPIFPRTVNYAEWTELKEYPLLNWNMGMVYRLKETDERIYPFGGLGRRTIGSLVKEGRSYGIEQAYRKQLEGKSGKALRQRIAHDFFGRVAGGIEDPVDGMDIETTLDADLQVMADSLLRHQLSVQNAQWGTTMVMDVHTGELLAMVNLDKMKDGSYREGENRALKMTMDPGSTFKLATMITLLEDAHMSPMKEYDSNDGRTVRIAGVPVNDSHRGDHKIALKRAVGGSSNVYFAEAMWEYYGKTGRKKDFTDFLEQRLHLNAPMGLEELGERSPRVISEGSWEKVPDPVFKIVKMGYGYRVAVAPIHMLTLYNAVANGGRMMAPMLIRRFLRGNEVIEEFKPRVLNKRICSEETLSVVRECLEEVAVRGTAQKFFHDTTFVRVACKTGTAHDTSPEGYRYDQYLGSMAAYFPADNPRYTILTSILTRKQVGKSRFGNGLAGPVVKHLIDYIAMHESHHTPMAAEGTYAPEHIKGGDTNEVREVADRLTASLSVDDRQGQWMRVERDSLGRQYPAAETTPRNLVPDVRGMGLKEALFLLESRGLKVVVEGQGAVTQQSISARTPIVIGQQIKINLR